MIALTCTIRDIWSSTMIMVTPDNMDKSLSHMSKENERNRKLNLADVKIYGY